MVSPKDHFSRLQEKQATGIATVVSRMALDDAIIKPKSSAQWTYERLVKHIQEFEANLDEDHEIGARLVSFGSDLKFHIEDMGYHGPDIITFYGKNDLGEDVQLIQNVSQLSVLLVAMKKVDEKPKRIGFMLEEKTDE